MRLNPYHPERFWNHLGRAQYSARSYADAIASYSKLTAPDHAHHAFLAASSAQLGNRTAAGAHAREVLQREPAFTAQAFVGTLHYRNPTDGEQVREGLLKAGLPDSGRIQFAQSRIRSPRSRVSGLLQQTDGEKFARNRFPHCTGYVDARRTNCGRCCSWRPCSGLAGKMGQTRGGRTVAGCPRTHFASRS